jgi:hypothetical protein
MAIPARRKADINNDGPTNRTATSPSACQKYTR